MLYFSHETNAANDYKIVSLRLECGGAAVDAYWYLVEMMYREESGLNLLGNRTLTNVVSHGLNVGLDTLETWIKTMIEVGLFDIDSDGETIYSQHIIDEIEKYAKKVETARQNGMKGGRKPKANRTANQVGTKSQSVRKTKEKKSKGIGSYKKEPIPETYASRAEEGAEAQSQVCPHCSHCGDVAKFNARSMCFICPTCGELRGKEEVTFE